MIRRRRWIAAAAVVALAGCATAGATVVQEGNVRITVLSQVAPYRLPRVGTAPISVFLSGHVDAPHGGLPPQLESMKVEVNRAGLLQSRGLPVCRLRQIQPASTARALASCGDAVIGSGQFWAQIVLPDQGAYRTHGRLLVFNGRQHGRPALLAHIYTSNPFDNSFVVVFSIRHVKHGSFATELTASLPEALGTWGYVDRIKLTLKRKYRSGGRQLSYFNAGCPAPPGTRLAVYPLARATLAFANGQRLSADVEKRCGVKGD